MKHRGIIVTAIAFVLTLTSQLVVAGSISDTYTTGEVLTKANMDNIKAAVNDNDTRIRSESSDASLRIVRGSINSTGTISTGAGFTLVNDSTGVYTITYDNGFNAQATVTANTWTINGYVRVSSISTASFSLLIFNTAGALTNAGFHFIAIGN